MMNQPARTFLAIGFALSLPMISAFAAGSDPEPAFRNPPQDAKPGVWWHWMGSNVSREGITRDLEGFKDAGIASDQVRFSLRGTYKRDYCVQYRESDLNFIHRMMEQYGLFYFFEHTKDNHVMVIGDDPVVHVPIASPATVIFHDPGGGQATDRGLAAGVQYLQAAQCLRLQNA